MHTLFLASKSPRRREVLDLLHLPYRVCAADADESLPQDITMENAGEILAARKALAAKQKLIGTGEFDENALVLAADTLVYADGLRLGKPQDEADALLMLETLRGKTHFVCTGSCLIANGHSVSVSEVTKVTMRNFSAEEAAAYVRTGEPLDKAGAYGVQGIGSVLIERIDGDFFSVMGLSPNSIYKLFRAAGISYFDWISEKV